MRGQTCTEKVRKLQYIGYKIQRATSRQAIMKRFIKPSPLFNYVAQQRLLNDNSAASNEDDVTRQTYIRKLYAYNMYVYYIGGR